jgi:lipoyl(octanoyl) transferase
MQQVEVIIEPVPQSGDQNMAIDEALLNRAALTERPAVRWYRWSQATVSLGYFQSPAEIPPSLASLPVVRRLSGGGALVHHHEWTYSCAIPALYLAKQEPREFYAELHKPLIDELVRLGFPVSSRGVTHNRPDEPVLCFLREDENDLICDSRKVLGSAQRRRKGAVLQHGGLLLAKSEFAPELPGLSDLAPNVSLPDFASFASVVGRKMAAIIGKNGQSSQG